MTLPVYSTSYIEGILTRSDYELFPPLVQVCFG